MVNLSPPPTLVSPGCVNASSVRCRYWPGGGQQSGDDPTVITCPAACASGGSGGPTDHNTS